MRSSGSTTVELQCVDLPAPPPPTKGLSIEPVHGPSLSPKISPQSTRVLGELGGSEPDPTLAINAAQRWNESWETMFRVSATFFSFFVMGANDAAYGALIPYIAGYYHLTHTVVSLVFLSPFIGYVTAALLNNWLHLNFGQRGIAVLSGSSHALAYVIMACHPPYVGLVFAYAIVGFGNGVGDAAWNAWVGSLANSSELLGFLHSVYGVGGVVSPLIATTMITQGRLLWYAFYYVMIGLAAVELASLTWAFWRVNGAEYRTNHREGNADDDNGLTEALFHMPSARVAWVCALFLLFYVGVEVALGGWIVFFMIEVRHVAEFASGMSAMGFWLGIAIGRAVLGFVTPRVGVKLATSIYIGAAMGLELIFWLVPQFYVSAVAVSLQGFFLGPLFPSAVLVASKLLPKNQHVTVIGFAAAFGGCGAAILPFVIGILAQASGVQVLQPVILALLGAMVVIWLLLPRINKKRD